MDDNLTIQEKEKRFSKLAIFGVFFIIPMPFCRYFAQNLTWGENNILIPLGYPQLMCFM